MTTLAFPEVAGTEDETTETVLDSVDIAEDVDVLTETNAVELVVAVV